MAVPVDIFVKDESVLPLVMPGVEVGIFDSGTGALVSQATSDGAGKASFLLPGAVSPGLTYEVRLFKLGVSFHGLNSIQVVEPVVTTNKFDVTGADGNLLSVSGSSLLCRCSGLFVGLNGQPIKDTLFRITANSDLQLQSPKIFSGSMISGDIIEAKTDLNGRISIDLIRTAKYYISFAGNDDEIWPINVPDQSSVSLIELIHPRPISWTWDQTLAPGNAISVAVGEVKDIEVTILLSDYSTTKEISTFFDLTTAPGTFSELAIGSGLVSIKGLAIGVDLATPTVKSTLYPTRFPTQPPTASALTITVTP